MTEVPFHDDSNASGVSWAAVIGGAFVTASLSLILIILGVGLGLSSVSPWSGAGASATAIGLSAIVWLIATQAIASGLGGYLAGRLRTKWSTVHSDEVYFRDTAHGFLVWAVGVVITAAFLGSTVSLIVSSGAKLAATKTEVGAIAAATGRGANVTAAAGSPLTEAALMSGPQSAVATSEGYLTDSLLRADRISRDITPAIRLEIGLILAEALRKGTLPDADRAYISRMIATHTEISLAEAEKRVDAVYAQGKSIAADAELAARNVADEARRAAAKASLWIFVSMLTGAFSASLAATIGGRQRECIVCNVVDKGVRNS